MPRYCTTCERRTGDDDPDDECPDCRDKREQREQDEADDEPTEDQIRFCGPCRVCAPMDQEHCRIKTVRERRQQERAARYFLEDR